MSDNQNQGGRGGGRNHQANRQGGRGQGGFRNNKKNNGQKNTSNPRGACEELKDNVCTVGDARMAHSDAKTTEAIANCIQSKFDKGQDVRDAIVTMEQIDMEQCRPEQVDDEENISYVDKLIVQQEVKEFVGRMRKYQDNMNKAYGLIMGQCTQGVKNKLESRDDWEELQAEHNPIDLLKAIKEITHSHQDSKCPIALIHKSLVSLLTILKIG